VNAGDARREHEQQERPNGADAVAPSRGLGRISSRTDQRHRWCGHTLVDLLHPPTF
jgi:hypothetical protein